MACYELGQRRIDVPGAAADCRSVVQMGRARGACIIPSGPNRLVAQVSSTPLEAIQTVLNVNIRGTSKLCPWGNGLLKNHDRIPHRRCCWRSGSHRCLPVSALAKVESSFRSRAVRRGRARLPALGSVTRSFFFDLRPFFGTIKVPGWIGRLSC